MRLILAFVLLCSVAAAEDLTLFKNLTYGMTWDEVLDSFDRELSVPEKDDGTALIDKGISFCGLDWSGIYLFTGKRTLKGVTLSSSKAISADETEKITSLLNGNGYEVAMLGNDSSSVDIIKLAHAGKDISKEISNMLNSPDHSVSDYFILFLLEGSLINAHLKSAISFNHLVSIAPKSTRLITMIIDRKKGGESGDQFVGLTFEMPNLAKEDKLSNIEKF